MKTFMSVLAQMAPHREALQKTITLS